LSTISHPTLVVGAADSPPEFHGMTDRIAEAIPGSRQVLVEGGHLVDPSHPEVIRFVQEVVSGG
jgi:pimeloyl-ACP methyl ester carboxylesterase